MSNENLQTPQDQIWKHYQFVFQNADTVNEQVSASIREKIASLDLQTASSDILYEEMGKNPLTVDIYLEQNIDNEYMGLPEPSEERLYSAPAGAKKLPAIKSIMATAAEDTAVMAEDDIQVQAVTFKGAVRNPPPPAEPLP